MDLNTDKRKKISSPLSSHVSVAASTVADSSPTPTPFNTACAASVPVILLANAYRIKWNR